MRLFLLFFLLPFSKRGDMGHDVTFNFPIWLIEMSG